MILLGGFRATRSMRVRYGLCVLQKRIPDLKRSRFERAATKVLVITIICIRKKKKTVARVHLLPRTPPTALRCASPRARRVQVRDFC